MKNWYTQDVETLFSAILTLDTLSQAKDFFRDLLTDAEIAELSNRFKAAKMLDAGVSYREIVAETGLSSTTVARISKWLQNGSGGYKRAIAITSYLSSHSHPEGDSVGSGAS